MCEMLPEANFQDNGNGVVQTLCKPVLFDNQQINKEVFHVNYYFYFIFFLFVHYTDGKRKNLTFVIVSLSVLDHRQYLLS